MTCLEGHGVVKNQKAYTANFIVCMCTLWNTPLVWCGGWIYSWPGREKNWRLLTALRISPELPEHSLSNTALSETRILPQLCIELRVELWENMKIYCRIHIKNSYQNVLSTARLPFTFPVSRVEILVRTFIIVVGATGLKLQTEHRKQCSGT